MRTTITLDPDVGAKLKSLARRSGRAFRDVVNETLRRGLVQSSTMQTREAFKVEARDLGQRRPGLRVDNIGDLLEHVEGPLHR